MTVTLETRNPPAGVMPVSHNPTAEPPPPVLVMVRLRISPFNAPATPRTVVFETALEVAVMMVLVCPEPSMST